MGEHTADALTNKNAWLVSQTWDVLHYIPGVTSERWSTWWDDDEHAVIAICGRKFEADLPGIFSRMGTRRCRACCKKLGIPHGSGAPPNDKALASVSLGAGDET